MEEKEPQAFKRWHVHGGLLRPPSHCGSVLLCGTKPVVIAADAGFLASSRCRVRLKKLCSVEDTLSSQTEESPPRPCLLSFSCLQAVWAASAKGLAGVRSQKNSGDARFSQEMRGRKKD